MRKEHVGERDEDRKERAAVCSDSTFFSRKSYRFDVGAGRSKVI